MSSIPEVVLAGAADPADAAHRAETVLDALAAAGHDPGQLSDTALTILALAAQRAPYLARLLARDPGRLARVAADPHLHRAKPPDAIAGELAERLAAVPADDADAFDQVLRRFRADEMVRLGARELALGNRADVGAELSHLADACFDAAIGFHGAALSARYGPPHCDDAGARATMVVIGMGKLGGEELNFASDVDVIYVYSSDHGAAGELSLHEYFCKLAERVTGSIGRFTPEDVVFRVDLRLRPEGSSGAIANSLAQTEHYYETWGRAWERQAWLKARPCAGDALLGAEVMQMMRPFVHPRSTSPAIIDDVTELNRRIKSELVGGGGVEDGFDLKNGVGGIREIEFFVQAHQLIHGGHRPTLRSRNTLVALDQLLFAGLVSEAEHQSLAHAYRYLRHAEHLLQLDSGRQTQRLPAEPGELERFAHRLGHANAAELEAELAEHTARVAELFATLGGDGDVPPEVTALLSGNLDAERERGLLDQLGFADPDRAQQALDRARRKPMSPFHAAARGAAARVAPALLAEICTSPDPDQALEHLIDLIARRGAFSSLWGLFEASPMLTRLIASLFGTSEFLSKSFVASPELIDTLLQTGRASPRTSLTQLRARLAERVAGIDPDDLEARWSRLAELKQSEVLRIGLADIGGDLDVEAVWHELSLLAEVVLDAAFTIVADAMRARHGVPRDASGEPAELAILAMGKLGARELGYASDLDSDLRLRRRRRVRRRAPARQRHLPVAPGPAPDERSARDASGWTAVRSGHPPAPVRLQGAPGVVDGRLGALPPGRGAAVGAAGADQAARGCRRPRPGPAGGGGGGALRLRPRPGPGRQRDRRRDRRRRGRHARPHRARAGRRRHPGPQGRARRHRRRRVRRPVPAAGVGPRPRPAPLPGHGARAGGRRRGRGAPRRRPRDPGRRLPPPAPDREPNAHRPRPLGAPLAGPRP